VEPKKIDNNVMPYIIAADTLPSTALVDYHRSARKNDVVAGVQLGGVRIDRELVKETSNAVGAQPVFGGVQSTHLCPNPARGTVIALEPTAAEVLQLHHLGSRRDGLCKGLTLVEPKKIDKNVMPYIMSAEVFPSTALVDYHRSARKNDVVAVGTTWRIESW
jgi:hypothetical protein